MHRSVTHMVAVMAVVMVPVVTATVQAQAPKCGDERDDIAKEYVDSQIHNLPDRPPVSCRVFHGPKDSRHFRWDYELNGRTEPRHANWGWLDDDFLRRLDDTYDTYGSRLTGNGAWRCPRKNTAVGSVHADSWHQFGRAIDIALGPDEDTLRIAARINGLQIEIKHNHIHLELDN